MSNFNSYAKEVDQIAKTVFDEYRKSEAAFKKAEAQAKLYPKKNGFTDADYIAKSTRAEAEFMEAKQRLTNAKKAMETKKSELETLRKKLTNEIEKEYSADPAQLDGNTLELLKSGILKGNEYERLFAKAKADGNPTMMRMIGKYAGDAAKVRSDKNGWHDSEAQALRMVEHQSRTATGASHLQAFDNLAEVYNRCANNPAMIDHWEELTNGIIEK